MTDGCRECVVCQRSRRGQNNVRTRDSFALSGVFAPDRANVIQQDEDTSHQSPTGEADLR